MTEREQHEHKHLGRLGPTGQAEAVGTSGAGLDGGGTLVRASDVELGPSVSDGGAAPLGELGPRLHEVGGPSDPILSPRA
eukprot:1473930-Pyramimonas_sp.AAC.1